MQSTTIIGDCEFGSTLNSDGANRKIFYSRNRRHWNDRNTTKSSLLTFNILLITSFHASVDRFLPLSSGSL